jgi:hypothetical protein
VNTQGGDEFLDSTVTGDETLVFHHAPESKQAGKKFDDYDEVQEVMTWFKGLAADFCDSGNRIWFKDLINVWTMLKNKVMCRQIIHSVALVN